jgi:hypothetical protein
MRCWVVQSCLAALGEACCCSVLLLQGGIFSLKLQFSERYPEKPPRVRFTCDIFHPNVSNSWYANKLTAVHSNQTDASPGHVTHSGTVAPLSDTVLEFVCHSPAYCYQARRSRHLFLHLFRLIL